MLKWPSLEQRSVSTLTLLFKIIHHLIQIPDTELFLEPGDTTNAFSKYMPTLIPINIPSSLELSICGTRCHKLSWTNQI